MDTKKKRDREVRKSRKSTNKKMNSTGKNSHKSTDVRHTARRNKRNSRAGKGSSKAYIASGLGVTALLLCAFYLPQLLFQVRDNALCSITALSERENVDVLIGDSYEPSLHNRMYNFAEGLARGVSYYVSEQDMAVDEELYERLNGLGLEPIAMLMDFRLINSSFMDYFMVQQRKQYVIYSDDYAQGVNFIIWYLELVGPSGAGLEILMDAETSTIYGIKTERNSLLTEKETDKWMYYIWGGSLGDHLLSSGLESISQLWMYLAMEFEAVSIDELEEMYTLGTFDGVYVVGEKSSADSNIELQERIRKLAALSEGAWQDDNELIFTLPYEEYSQTLKLQLIKEEPWPTYRYHDVFYGIESICRMIPEFMN